MIKRTLCSAIRSVPLARRAFGEDEVARDFPDARLNEAASRQTLSRVWWRQQWREDKVGS
jgi:hypothetical protein